MTDTLSRLSTYLNRSCERVLVVDDDPGQREQLRAVLEKTGFAVDSMALPSQVLEVLNGEIYPLAFIDVGLPEMDGLELAAQLILRGKIQDVVFLSSNESMENVLQAIKLGAWDFLYKPLDDNNLELLLNRFKERRRLMMRVIDAEQRHSMLIRDLPVLIYSIDEQLELVFINQASADILGFTPEEALNTPGFFLSRIHPRDRQRIRTACEQAFSTRAALSFECRLLHRHGRVIHGILRTFPSTSCNGDGQRMEGVFMDITDRVYLEKALVQNEKLKTLGSISAEVAHEIRNPLMSIAGFARRLDKKVPDNPEVGIILRESQRLEKLLNRISAYLKPVEISRRQCHVNALLADSIGLLHPELDEKGVHCVLTAMDNLSTTLADPELLTQVFINLLRYALGTVEPGGSLPVQTEESAQNIHVEIRCGVDPNLPEDPELLFLPFDEGGQSIGLPLTYRMIKNLGGLLTFNREGDQALFVVSLPKADISSSVGGMFSEPERSQEDKYCFDPASGVLTPQRFEDLLERKVRLAARDGLPLSLVFIDVDNFTEHTRHHGQDKANENLAHITEALTAALPKAWHLLARYGRQEFAAILPDADLDDAGRLAEAMRRRVVDLRLARNGSPDVFLTVSLGIVSCVPRGTNAMQDMIAQASKALFMAKQQGRNTTCHFDSCQDS